MPSKYTVAAFVDTSVPDMSDLLKGLELDQEEFARWLGGCLGGLRFWQKVDGDWPTADEDAASLKRYSSALSAVAGLRSKDLTPIVSALLRSEYRRDGIAWEDSLRQLRFLALKLSAAARRARLETKKPPGRRGPKKGRTQRRDELLADIVERLKDAGLTATDALDTAEKILIRARIEAPSGERSVRRAIRRAGH